MFKTLIYAYCLNTESQSHRGTEGNRDENKVLCVYACLAMMVSLRLKNINSFETISFKGF